jgi:GGDEF domain-containing protein
MSLQGPILIVADKPAIRLAQALTEAGAFPVIEASWPGAQTALTEVKPSAVVIAALDPAHIETAQALTRQATKVSPLVPVLARLRDDAAIALPDTLPIREDAPVERLIARLSAALRVRALQATVSSRSLALKAERGIVAELPDGDPLDAATVLLIGRGRHHPTLSVAVGERMGVVGALSVDTAARCLAAREVDGVVIGDGLAAGAVEAFLTLFSEDPRFRELPVALLGGTSENSSPPNLVCARDPLLLLQRAIPLIRLRAFETALKRLLASIECKGMLDPQTGLLNSAAFGPALGLAIEDAGERGVGLSLARFAFEYPIDHRTSFDAARLVSRLLRDSDFACRQEDGSILLVYGDTDLRDAHVAARRLASALKHTMLRPGGESPAAGPSVTLATLKSTDTVLTLLARVIPRPVVAA